MIQINADEERFTKLYGTANAENVAQFYLVDRENPTSVLSSLFAARENARTLRPLIPPRCGADQRLLQPRAAADGGDAAPSRVSGLCAYLKEQCQAHAGITDGTFYRDQSWAFYCIGKYIERARPDVAAGRHQVSHAAAVGGRRGRRARHQPVARAAARGVRLPGLSAGEPELHDAGVRGGLPADEPVLPAQRDGVRAAGRDTSRPAQLRLRAARRVRGAGAAGRVARGVDGPDDRPDTGARAARVPRLGAVAAHRFAGRMAGAFWRKPAQLQIQSQDV